MYEKAFVKFSDIYTHKKLELPKSVPISLVGIGYDFFEIGEFWGCKSVFNDFGLQFRFFFYTRASLTGGVALNAGRSVVTIATKRTSSPTEHPHVR